MGIKNRAGKNPYPVRVWLRPDVEQAFFVAVVAFVPFNHFESAFVDVAEHSCFIVVSLTAVEPYDGFVPYSAGNRYGVFCLFIAYGRVLERPPEILSFDVGHDNFSF